MKSYNFFERELYYVQFSGYFPKFSAQQFQSTLIKASVMEFKRVLGCRLQFCSYQNVTAGEIIFSKFWRWDYPYKNSLWWTPILVGTYNIFEKKLFVDIARQVILQNVKFETHSYALQSSKKDHATRHALRTKLSFKSF